MGDGVSYKSALATNLHQNFNAFVLTMQLLRVWNLDDACVYFAHPAMSMDVHSDRVAPVLSQGDVDLFRGDIGRFFSGLVMEL